MSRLIYPGANVQWGLYIDLPLDLGQYVWCDVRFIVLYWPADPAMGQVSLCLIYLMSY